eukprot:28886-Eustigmatos_ZCMA.PRE.1
MDVYTYRRVPCTAPIHIYDSAPYQQSVVAGERAHDREITSRLAYDPPPRPLPKDTHRLRHVLQPR